MNWKAAVKATACFVAIPLVGYYLLVFVAAHPAVLGYGVVAFMLWMFWMMLYWTIVDMQDRRQDRRDRRAR